MLRFNNNERNSFMVLHDSIDSNNKNSNKNSNKNNDKNNNNNSENNNKFGFDQRIESIKCLVVGAVIGGLALAPIDAFHNILFPIILLSNTNDNGLAQFEFDCDAGAIQGGLFAIVYRYCIRQDRNEQLNQGVIGSFIITRTLSRIVIPTYCVPFPLFCGPPFQYLDWYVLLQLAVNGIESTALFGLTAIAIDTAMEKGYISKFPS